MKQITHKQYVSSPYWVKFSKKILNDPNIECAMCHRKKWSIYKVNTKKHKSGHKKRLIILNLHHVDYEGLGLGKDHVIPLCRRCHQLSHDLERAGRLEPFWKDVYNKLLEVSNWKYIQAEYFEVPDDFKLSTKKSAISDDTAVDQ
jgi:hypothetical protein